MEPNKMEISLQPKITTVLYNLYLINFRPLQRKNQLVLSRFYCIYILFFCIFLNNNSTAKAISKYNIILSLGFRIMMIYLMFLQGIQDQYTCSSNL